MSPSVTTNCGGQRSQQWAACNCPGHGRIGNHFLLGLCLLQQLLLSPSAVSRDYILILTTIFIHLLYKIIKLTTLQTAGRIGYIFLLCLHKPIFRIYRLHDYIFQNKISIQILVFLIMTNCCYRIKLSCINATAVYCEQ